MKKLNVVGVKQAPAEKTCFKCGRTLPITEFYVHPQMGDGHLNKCKDCARRDVSEHRASNPDAELKTRLKACAKHPTKKNAYMALDAAVRAGVIEKPTVCSGCGRSDDKHRIEAHHYDYSRPLDVIWLCTLCHSQMDRMRREREGLSGYTASRAVSMVRDGEVICTFDSIADAARAVGRSRSAISECLSGKSSSSAGSQWIYADVGTPATYNEANEGTRGGSPHSLS